MKIHFSIPWRIFVSIILAIGMAGAPGHSTRASAVTNTWTVNTLTDDVFGTCDASQCTLSDAIYIAGSGDTINFTPSLAGTINIFDTLWIGMDLTIHGSPNVTISGGMNKRVFYIDQGITVNFDNLTIVGGKAETSSGGAIYIFNDSTVNISNSTIYANSATSGGGIYNQGTLSLTDVNFDSNIATLDGGAIDNEDGTVTITRGTLINNFAGNYGGGIYSNNEDQTVYDQTVSVTDSTFDSNSAKAGGGIYNEYGNLIVSGSTFVNNTAGVGNGGGINSQDYMEVTNSTFTWNSAVNGGAIYNDGQLFLTNSTLSGNAASEESGDGADVYNDFELDYANNILAAPDSGNNCFNNGSIGTHTKNLVEVDAENDNTCLPESFDPPDPLLDPLDDNGGPTETMALQYGSPTIDAGDAATCSASPVSGKDQRGIPRSDGSCDIGAYEYGTATPDPFSKSSPTYGAIVLSISPTLAWNSTANAESYEYCYSITISSCTHWIPVGTSTSATLNNLAYSQTYYWEVRAVAAGGALTANGGLHWAFTTASPPSVTTNAATGISFTGATLNGTVNANHDSATVRFEYGPDTTYGYTVIAAESPVTGASDTPVSKSITGLAPNTLYHFRVEADNSLGTSYSADQTFSTACFSPAIVTNTNDNGAGSLRQAIHDVCTGGTVNFDSSLAGQTITLSTGRLDMDRNMSIVGLAPDPMTISGNHAQGVFMIGEDVTATLDSLVISEGSDTNGAGIYADHLSNLTLKNSTLENNVASHTGGGIYSVGTLTVVKSTLRNNAARTDPPIGNTSAGAIYNFGGPGGTVTLTDSTVEDNTAENAGGVYVYYHGSLTVSGSFFKGNSSTFSGGGAIFTSEYTTLNVTDSTFDSNTGNGSGGAIHNSSSSIAKVTNSTLLGNSGLYGGAIYDDNSLTVANSTFSGNSSTNGGGGIYEDGGALTMTNSTLAGNSSTSGNGLDLYNSGGSGTLKNNILASSAGANCGGTASFTDGGHNLDKGNSCGFTAAGSQVNTDPLLDSLADNGGPTQTMALLASSPAIDAGDDAVCAAAPVNNLDQRGVIRPQGDHCDIGAYEYVPPTPCTVTTSADSGPGSLREAIADTSCSTITFNPALAGNTITLASQLGLTHAVTIDSSALAPRVTISGAGSTRVFYVNSGVTATLKGLAITHGWNANNGGGIYNKGTLTVDTCMLDSNGAGDRGGGIYNDAGTLTVTFSTFQYNFANVSISSLVAGGGGIQNDGTASSLTVNGSLFAHNTTERAGGAISTIEGTATVTDSFFGNNHAGDSGGAIHDGNSLTISGSTLVNNDAVYDGGGIYNYNYLTMFNCTLANNSALFGGGVYDNHGYGLTLINNTLSGNSANAGGGGGLNVQHERALDYANNIIANSSTAAGGDCVIASSTISRNLNNLDDDHTCNATLTGDPKLHDLDNNGGLHSTMALMPGSPAIDAGNDTICTAAPVNNRDQRGVIRPQGDHCDIGAYEAQLYSVPLVTGWNLVSFRLHPVDTSITSVLASLGDQYSLVYAWDAVNSKWLIYDPALGALNDLNSLDETLGFWIRMISDQTLTVSGRVLGSTSIILKSGWNLAGYPSAANGTLPDVLSAHGVGTDFSLVYAYHANDESAWKLFDRTGNPLLNDLTELSPGWGYWIKASDDHTWSVP
jgi:predicted outer membrane repeat protein